MLQLHSGTSHTCSSQGACWFCGHPMTLLLLIAVLPGAPLLGVT
jgi:hypothetical protein